MVLMATKSVSQPDPSTESRRLPVKRWLGRTMRPSFLVSMCADPRGLVLVAHNGLQRLQIPQLRHVRSCQSAADRGLRNAHAACKAGLQHSLLAQLDDERSLGCINAEWRAGAPGQCVGQRGLATGQIAGPAICARSASRQRVRLRPVRHPDLAKSSV